MSLRDHAEAAVHLRSHHLSDLPSWVADEITQAAAVGVAVALEEFEFADDRDREAAARVAKLLLGWD